uniref:Putative tetralaris n=1 Tax=Rhipicephalus pulchellus TaxID=72859 RepID=L7LTI8_RHIPC
MALLHSALAFLVTITYVHAAPQVPAFCRERRIKSGCRQVNETWYYEPRMKTCVSKRYVLCGGGQGGFPTKQSCMGCQPNNVKKGPNACPPTPQIGGCQPVHHAWYFDPEYNHCRPFQSGECSSGRNHFSNEYKCKEVCSSGVVKPPERCQKPLARGRCHALHNFWYFDFRKNDCFKYPAGLCGAGGNMFPEKNACLAACKKPPGKRPRTCLDKPRTGGCQSKLGWFFDYNVGHCKMSSFGECGAGGNYFASEVKCKQECLRIGNPHPVCSAEPISAYCLGFGTYWYFDQKKNNCYKFNGGWCGKNANGFVSYQACMGYCSYPEGPSYGQQSKNNVPPVQQQQQLKVPGK